MKIKTFNLIPILLVLYSLFSFAEDTIFVKKVLRVVGRAL